MTSHQTPPPPQPKLALGAISGTSMDGIDVATIVTDGLSTIEHLGGISVPYSQTLRSELLATVESYHALANNLSQSYRPARVRDVILNQHLPRLGALQQRVTEQFCHAIEQEIARLRGVRGSHRKCALRHERGIDVIGLHGQTVLHHPSAGISIQLGDGEYAAAMLGKPVVSQFRLNDLRHGGQGAPLTPIYHWALLQRAQSPEPFTRQPRAMLLNLGGVGNVTFVGCSGTAGTRSRSRATVEAELSHCPDLIAFDVGTGNALLDDCIRLRAGLPFDDDGRLARTGTIDHAVLARFRNDSYFDLPPPKSLDRNYFHWMLDAVAHLETNDALATLAGATVWGVTHAISSVAAEVERCWVGGGGARNGHLMESLNRATKITFASVEQLPAAAAIDGDLIEAEAFAYMAVRRMRALPISFPTTTGVARPLTGGRLHLPAALR